MKYFYHRKSARVNTRVTGVFLLKQKFIPQAHHQSGMTLIEIMIVIAIMAIILTVAVPNYSSYILQQRRADAHHLLQVNAQNLQRCLTLVGAYNGGCNIITTSAEGHYTLSSTLTPQTWSLTAVAATDGRQENDTDCASIILSHTGQKSATGKKPDTCW